ncbi:MAG TPA: hypothetical protein VF258_03565 [Luteolibacter sp.]
MSCDDEALELIGESIDPALALSAGKGNYRDSVFHGLARQLIATRTVEELVTLMAGLEADLKRDISFHIGEQWPAERLDDFGRLATAMRDPDMLDCIRDKLPPEEMARWMMRYVAEHPDPEFARSVTQTGALFFARFSAGRPAGGSNETAGFRIPVPGSRPQRRHETSRR